jgi:hypothetical protein
LTRAHARLRGPLALLLLACASCSGMRTLSDPTLQLETSGGGELGVSTEYGVVFLGHTSRSGQVEITAWFGDGPDVERGVIEPVGPVLCTIETQIRLPDVALDLADPAPGATVWVFGRDAQGPWKEQVTVVSDPRVEGLVTTFPARLRAAQGQIGAGVYTIPAGGDERTKRLLGLAAGRLVLRDGDGGSERELLAVVGPRELWRLVTRRRDAGSERPFVYREDIL